MPRICGVALGLTWRCHAGASGAWHMHDSDRFLLTCGVAGERRQLTVGVLRLFVTSGLPDFRTSGLPDFRTSGLPDFRTALGLLEERRDAGGHVAWAVGVAADVGLGGDAGEDQDGVDLGLDAGDDVGVHAIADDH